MKKSQVTKLRTATRSGPNAQDLRRHPDLGDVVAGFADGPKPPPHRPPIFQFAAPGILNRISRSRAVSPANALGRHGSTSESSLAANESVARPASSSCDATVCSNLAASSSATRSVCASPARPPAAMAQLQDGATASQRGVHKGCPWMNLAYEIIERHCIDGSIGLQRARLFRCGRKESILSAIM